jgi:hypothetical protein
MISSHLKRGSEGDIHIPHSDSPLLSPPLAVANESLTDFVSAIPSASSKEDCLRSSSKVSREY